VFEVCLKNKRIEEKTILILHSFIKNELKQNCLIVDNNLVHIYRSKLQLKKLK
jgi:hypothetical protein